MHVKLYHQNPLCLGNMTSRKLTKFRLFQFRPFFENFRFFISLECRGFWSFYFSGMLYSRVLYNNAIKSYQLFALLRYDDFVKPKFGMAALNTTLKTKFLIGQVRSRKHFLVSFYWLNHARNDRITSFKHIEVDAMYFFSDNLWFFSSMSLQLFSYLLFVKKKSIINHISLMQRVQNFLFYRKVILKTTLIYCNISPSSLHTSEIWRLSILKFSTFFGYENNKKQKKIVQVWSRKHIGGGYLWVCLYIKQP